MDFLDKQIAPPRSWEKFEDLSRALFAAIWADPTAKKNGRGGQPQHGVDVYGSLKGPGGPLQGVQCKGKDSYTNAKVTVAGFDAELRKADSFTPPLKHWTLATTAPDDAKLQRHVRNVSAARQAEGKFTVDVLGWGSLQALIAGQPEVVQQFYAEHISPLGNDSEILQEASKQAIDAIEDVLRHGEGSMFLLRQGVWQNIGRAVESGDIIRLTGEGGSGKSGLLRRLAKSHPGPVFAITDNRTTAQSLQQHLQQLGVSSTPPQLFESLAQKQPALLAIDGADRLLLSERRGVVIDALRLIAGSEDPSRWRIATTARNFQQQDLIATALKEAGFVATGREIEVPAVSDDDTKAIAEAFPSFAPLLSRDELSAQARSLFIVRELLKRKQAPTTFLTEIDMAAAWATAELNDADKTARRTKALSELGQQLLRAPWSRPARALFDPIGLQQLIDEGSVLSPAHRDEIALKHDVHEDWLLARALYTSRKTLGAVLRQAREPLWWQRAIRLTAQTLLEEGDIAGWSQMLRSFDDEPNLDPAWARAVLVAPLYSERADEILPLIETTLLENDARMLERLLETLLVFESRTDPVLLASPQLAELDESIRAAVAAHYKFPVMRSWFTFLRWSLGHWESWPAILIPRLSEVAILFTRSFRAVDNPISKSIAAIAYRWLGEIENALQYDRWGEERSEPFNTKLGQRKGWKQTRDRLREVLTQAVTSAPDIVEEYLERLAQLRGMGGARKQLLGSPGMLPSALPKAWANMCLAQFVPPRQRIRYGPDYLIRPEYFSYHEMHDSGIKGDTGFFPSSPLRGGFADLFRADEAEALRLFHRLEMRASVFFRWYMKCHDRRRPVPITVHMPWQDYRLWGDDAVYRWSRGVLGSHVLGSAYLALDDWLHEQVAQGRPLAELFSLILQNNGLIATAAPLVAAVGERINDSQSISLAGPLLAVPRLWDYDVRRHIDDQGFAYRIGFSIRDHHLDALERNYARNASRQPLRNALMLPFRLKAASTAQEAFDQCRANWSASDLEEFDNDHLRADLVEEREQRIERLRSDSDPAQIRAEEIADGIQVSIAPPKEAEAEIEEMTAQHRRLEDASRLANWVNASREMHALADGFTETEAIEFAEKLSNGSRSIATSLADFAEKIAGGAIVGAAATIANYSDAQTIRSNLEWIQSWLIAGATARRNAFEEGLTVDEAILPQDAQVLAAWGLAALASRGLADPSVDDTVVGLAVHRLHAVAEGVIEGLIGEERPEFVRTVHVAALDSCIIDIGYWWKGEEERRAAAKRTVGLRLKAAQRALKNGDVNRLPIRPPAPFAWKWMWSWKKPWNAKRIKVRSKRVLDWGRSRAVLMRTNWSAVAPGKSQRGSYSAYLESLVEWTRIYAEDEARPHDGQFPYEWAHGLARVIGKFAASNGREEDWKPLTHFTYRDRAEELVGDYLDAVAHELIESKREPDDRFWSVWRPAAEWLLERSIPRKRDRYDHLSEFSRAAGLVGPYFTPIPPDWPHLEHVLGWINQWVLRAAHLPAAAYAALSIVERMTLDQRIKWFVPWLQEWTKLNGADESYWSYHGLGNKVATLLKPLAGRPDAPRAALRQYLSMMADAGSIIARETIPAFAAGRPAN